MKIGYFYPICNKCLLKNDIKLFVLNQTSDDTVICTHLLLTYDIMYLSDDSKSSEAEVDVF